MSTLADSFGCSPPITCPGSDNPLLNLSSESPDFPVFIGLNFGPVIPPPVLNHFTDLGCLGECDSTVSQQDADICAARQSAFCINNGSNPNFPPPPLICNTPQTAIVNCPDGLPFSYTVPAGLFCGNSQTLVNEQALAYATQLANAQKICLGNIPRCMCLNQSYAAAIPVSGATGTVLWSVVSGALPPGIVLNPNGTITGVATVNGTYSFTVQALTAVGTFMRKPYVITVLQITTAVIPSYTVGAAYSFQMVAAGGSGNYAWKILSGALPDGLVIDVSGLIHGTPTGANTGTQPIMFGVIDVTCEAVDRTFFTPRVALSTRSQTKIATILGYPEYIPSSPPKKYHQITWSGQAEQTMLTAATNQFIGGAKFIWNGSGVIDTFGNQTSKYQKLFYAACPKLGPWPPIISTPNFGLISATGFCWPPEPGSCPTCDPNDVNWAFVADVQDNSIGDSAQSGFENLLIDTSKRVSTSVSLDDSATGTFEVVSVGDVSTVPLTTINGIFAPWLKVTSTNSCKSQLSNEYTDAEALGNAQVINSNGATAETLPRTTGYVSRFTTVNFSLNLSNLVPGSSYVVTVDLFDSTSGTRNSAQYTVNASSSSAVINDSVPVPSPQHRITVLNPTIVFAP